MPNLPYNKPDRLADVMALIQVLALHKHGHRSNKGISDEMQGEPRSEASWVEIAKQHPEFFRVRPDTRLGVSLVSRHVFQDKEFPAEFVSILLEQAINLYDRQVEKANQWKAYIPIISAVAGALAGAFAGGIFTLLVQAWLTMPTPTP